MSFDVFFQSFADGDASDAGRAQVLGVLAPYLKPSPEVPQRLEHPAGQADIFGLTDDASMLVTHIDDGLWTCW